MAATVKTSNTVLLRRPLPPLPKKEGQTHVRKKPGKDKGKDVDTIKVLNSLKKQTTLQKSNDVLKENDKMKEYQRRIALVFTHYKPRGGDPFPLRNPRKALEIDFNAFIDDSYEPPPPIFKLNDFLKSEERLEDKIGSVNKPQAHIVEKPLEQWHIYENKTGKVERDKKDISCQKIMLDERVDLPEVRQRIPFRQHIIEEQAYLLENYSTKIGESLFKLHEAKSTKQLVIARPTYLNSDKTLCIGEDDVISKTSSQKGDTPIISQLYPQEYQFQDVVSDAVMSKKESRISAIDSENKDIVPSDKTGHQAENVEGESIVFNSPPLFFQGELCARSPSPFEFEDEQSIDPVELAVLQCIKNGGTKLILKNIPEELFVAPNLEILKLRNNPICVIPDGILQLKKLRNLILSFCRISSLPKSLFQLTNLEKLDLSYNEIEFVPNEVRNLRSLEVLNLEGNQLMSLPIGIVLLPLRTLNLVNNFTHPQFWKSGAPLQPQSLLEICATVLTQQQQLSKIRTQDVKLKTFLDSVSKCEFCEGPKFGQGLPLIKPLLERFGVKNLPILFHVCSPHCHQILRISTEFPI